MRLVTVKGPVGVGKRIAETAFAAGVSQVSLRQERRYTPDGREATLDVVEVESATPKARRFEQ